MFLSYVTNYWCFKSREWVREAKMLLFETLKILIAIKESNKEKWHEKYGK